MLTSLSKHISLLLLSCVLILVSTLGYSQVTKVRGTITDSETSELMPFVNISYAGTSVGTITDFNGEYFLETRTPTDTLVISYIGYKTQKIKIKKGSFQNADFKMEPDRLTLDEVVILPGENPAFRILREINDHKEINSNKDLDSYHCEVYNKIEFDANNIGDWTKKRRLLKQFSFIFDYMDTSAVSGKEYLPIFFVETISDYYHKFNPEIEKEVIKANRISGIKNESISQFAGKMLLDFQIYNNYIQVLGKSFVSPIAGFGRLYYKYYLIDSAYIDNQWCYQLTFKPKSKTEPCFTGDFWVHDTTFAIKKAKVRISKDANLNWVHDAVAEVEYEWVDKRAWLIKRDHLVVDFNITENNTVGFFGRKTMSYRNYVLNDTLPEKFITVASAENVVVEEGALEKDESYWAKARHDSLSEREVNIYKMVDSVQNVPLFKTYVDVITTIVTGYFKIWKIEIGPYIKLYSFNDIEGNRFKLGGRTSTKLSDKLFLEGHVAYGTRDRKFKFFGGFKYHFSKFPFRQIGFSYKDDLEQLGESPDALQEDNLLGSIFRRDNEFNLNPVIEYKAFYEHEWFSGFSNTIEFNHRILYPVLGKNAEDNFEMYYHNSESVDTVNAIHIRTTEFSLMTRFAYNEKFAFPMRERISLGTAYPVIKFKYTYGIKDFLWSEYEYHKIKLHIQHDFKINPIGKMDITMNAGKVFGELPYPLLEMHMGNETYWYDSYAFNTMNYYEFVSDTYIDFLITHYFEGFFLNKIPLLRKLKFREVVLLRGVFGSLSSKNRNFSEFPETLSRLYGPYLEGGIGIENILTIFRIDAIWRLTYLNKEYLDSKGWEKGDIMRFGIRIKMNFKL